MNEALPQSAGSPREAQAAPTSVPQQDDRTHQTEVAPPDGAEHQPRASLGQTFSAVLWSFFGVRKRSDHEQDVKSLNPIAVIAVGIILAIVFVLSLLAIASYVVKIS